MRATWYVLEDGDAANPADVVSDEKGRLFHKDGRPVAMKGEVPRSRGVDVPDAREMVAEASAGDATKTADLKPAGGKGYRTRGGKAD